MGYLYALDLSMTCSGVVIFDLDTLDPVYISSISTEKVKSTKDTSKRIRLALIGEEIEELKKKYPPEFVAIERTFNRFNTSTAVLYLVHGAVKYILRDCEQVYYSPKEIKKAILHGDASKKLIQQFINKKYPDIVFKNNDESDAFAIGLTYLIKNKLIKWK